jgi:hypothetical protein
MNTTNKNPQSRLQSRLGANHKPAFARMRPDNPILAEALKKGNPQCPII